MVLVQVEGAARKAEGEAQAKLAAREKQRRRAARKAERQRAVAGGPPAATPSAAQAEKKSQKIAEVGLVLMARSSLSAVALMARSSLTYGTEQSIFCRGCLWWPRLLRGITP